MKCRDAYPCLLACREAGALPPGVLEHLEACPRCRRRRRRLLRLDEALAGLSLPPPDPRAKDRLWQRLASLAPPGRPVEDAVQRNGRRRPGRLRPGRWLLPAATAAGLLLGLACGWLLWRPGPQAPEEVTARAQVRPAPPRAVAGEVVFRALGHDLRLAEAAGPQEQLQTLTGLALDLRTEAVRTVQEGPLEDLPQLCELYERVLRRGIVGRSRGLPARQRELLLPVLREQLEAGQRDLAQAAEQALPAAGGYLRQMRETSRQTALLLGPGAEPPAPPAGGDVPAARGSLLAVVVLHGLRLAEEPEPLPRADCCADIADRLAEVIALLAAQGYTEEASRLGPILGDFLERGVASSLTRAGGRNLTEVQWAHAERVGRRAGGAGELLQKNLDRAPRQARRALERALEAARRGRLLAELAHKNLAREKGRGEDRRHKGWWGRGGQGQRRQPGDGKKKDKDAGPPPAQKKGDEEKKPERK